MRGVRAGPVGKDTDGRGNSLRAVGSDQSRFEAGALSCFVCHDGDRSCGVCRFVCGVGGGVGVGSDSVEFVVGVTGLCGRGDSWFYDHDSGFSCSWRIIALRPVVAGLRPPIPPMGECCEGFLFGGPDRRRSGDLSIFSRTLYQLSYRTLEAKTRSGGPGFFCSATPTGLEPAASAVTGRRSNQLSYGANLTVIILQPKYFVVCTWYPQRDLNPCYRRERAAS